MTVQKDMCFSLRASRGFSFDPRLWKRHKLYLDDGHQSNRTKSREYLVSRPVYNQDSRNATSNKTCSFSFTQVAIDFLSFRKRPSNTGACLSEFLFASFHQIANVNPISCRVSIRRVIVKDKSENKTKMLINEFLQLVTP